MPLKVTFELSDRDLRYFRQEMNDVARRSANVPEARIIESASKAMGDLPEDVPEFVSQRAEKLMAMVEMLNDEEWLLAGKDRERVIKALTYFAQPHDLIPDTTPGIGFLDDAIMVELVVRELCHEIEAYDDFCRVRAQRDRQVKQGAAEKRSREEWLAARRAQLQTRMRRRRRRSRSSPGGSGRSRPVPKLW
jgi:uncharacterized membrane protein YkvA (DUF1232 family)